MTATINERNRIIEVIRRGQRGLDGDVGLTTTVDHNTTFTAINGHRGYVYRVTSAITINFEQAITLTNGWHVIVDAVGGAATLDPNGAETINGLATLVVPLNASALVYTDGTALYARFFYGSAATLLNGLPTAADKYIYGTGVGVWAEGDITAAGRAILDDASAGAQLTTLGVSTYAQTLLDDANAAAARATLVNSAGPEFISSQDASSDTSLDFTGFDATKYDSYEFVLSGVAMSDNEGLKIRTSTTGGSPYDSGVSDYAWLWGANINATWNSLEDLADDALDLTGGHSTTGVPLFSGTVSVLNADDANKTMVHWDISVVDTGATSTMTKYSGHGVRNAAEDVTALQFLPFTGADLVSGRITMFGYRNAA